MISGYSVKGFETLNPDFIDYVKQTAEVTPDRYPIVLNIIGNCLSQEEKETVEEISKLSAEAEHSIKLIEKHLRTLVKIESDRDPSQKTIGGPEDK